MTKAIVFVEIDIPFCFNTYGESPCTAQVGVTGDIKCFNSIATCQDRDHYIDDPKTIRFTRDSGFIPDDIDAIPTIVNIGFTPALVSLGKDLGTRSSLSVSFKDHPWPDTGGAYDKYLSERPYNPFTQGTFWGKFRSRQPFLRGRPLRLIRGSVGESIEDMEVRHYVIDSFDHNASDGSFTITAKDVIKLADDDRAQAPALSQGFLSAAITETDLTLELQPEGIGNEEYPQFGFVAIGGKEIVEFERDLTAGNDLNTVLLLHFDGADGSEIFIDSSSTPHTITGADDEVIDTDQFKFGGSSLLLDGGDVLTAPDHADWTPAGNFTVDFWLRPVPLSGTQFLFLHATGTDANNRYLLSLSATGALTFTVTSGGVTLVTMSSVDGVIVADTWSHIAVVRNGNDFRIYVNGVSVANVTDADAIPNYTGLFRIGEDNNNGNGYEGWIDEFRFSHVARWTTAFTPPTVSFQTSSDVMAITRAQMNTEAIDHDAQDRVQLVLSYEAENAADIIKDLFVNYAGIDESFIPIEQWQEETANFLNRVFTADIAESTGVHKLVSELIEDAALSIWWDDSAQLIRLRVIRAISTEVAIFDRDNYLQGTFSSKEQPNERRSQIWRYFAKRNPLEGQDDPDNYRSVALTVDLEAESDYGSSAIQKIFSRWIPFGGRSIADRANTIYLSRFRNPPRQFNFSTSRNNILVPILGGGYRIKGLGIQEATGEETNAPIQITRLNPDDAQFDIEAEEMLAEASDEDLSNRVITIDVNSFNINLREVHDSLFPAPVVETGVNVTCIIDSGVIVGSILTTLPAFDVGDWPVGFPITLIINGRIQGAGGDGGGFDDPEGDGSTEGEDGGVALYTRVDIDVEVSTGEIWGGGGGGGDPGGGGAGQVPGLGGGEDAAHSGQNGTTEVGGLGFDDGGAGGDPGEPGEDNPNDPVDDPGGAAGSAIDGVSFVTITVGPGDIRGPEIN